MQSKILSHYNNHKHFVHYSLIGFSGVFLDFAVFAVLYNILGMSPLLANVISTSCGITNNFFLNSRLNFKKKDLALLRFISFYATGLLGLVVSSLILRIFHDYFGFEANTVKFSSIVIVVILQYGLNKKISFRDYKPTEHSSLHIITEFMRNHWLEIVAILIAVAAFVAYVPKDLLGVDESDNFLAAKLILSGQLPYVDFFSHHMPGPYLISTGVYILANGDVLGYRIVYTVLLFAWLMGNFRLIHKYGNRVSASAYMALTGLAHGLLLQHELLAESFITLSVSTILIVLILIPRDKLFSKDWLALLLLLLFSIPFMGVVYIYLASILYILVFIKIRPAKLAGWLRLIVLAASPYILFAIYLVLTGSLHKFIFENITFNADYYAPFSTNSSPSPFLLVVNIARTSLEQIYTVFSHPVSHFTPLLLIVSYLLLPLCLWLRDRKILAVTLCACLLFLNPRVGLYGPGGIENVISGSISQHAELYRAVALLFGSLSFVYLIGQNPRHSRINPIINHGIVAIAVFTLSVTALGLIVTNNMVYRRDPTSFTQIDSGVNKIPSPYINVINDVARPSDYTWIGPIDFLNESFLSSRRATEYTFFMPWHQQCPTCRDTFYRQLGSEKPLVIAWQGDIEIPNHPVLSYQRDMNNFLSASYFKVDDKGNKAFDNLYFRNDSRDTIRLRLQSAGYHVNL